MTETRRPARFGVHGCRSCFSAPSRHRVRFLASRQPGHTCRAFAAAWLQMLPPVVGLPVEWGQKQRDAVRRYSLLLYQHVEVGHLDCELITANFCTAE